MIAPETREKFATILSTFAVKVAEKLLRTASRKLITGDENSLNQYIKITMAGMSDDYENSVSYLENFINVGINNRFDIEANYYLTFHHITTYIRILLILV